MRFLPVFICLLTFSGLYAQELKDRSEVPQTYVERQEKEFIFYPGGKMTVSLGTSGNLKIVGWDKGVVRLEAEKIVYSMPENAAREFLTKLPIRIRYTNSSSTIEVLNVPKFTGALEVNITLYVPKERTDIVVRMNNGDLSMDNINGWIEATVTKGNLDMKSISGYFSGKTQRGDVYVDMSGNRLSGQSFTVLTQSGTVDLQLPEVYSAALQLDTRNGKINVDYPPQEVDGEIVPPEIVIQKNVQQLKASIGSGGTPLRLATLSGDVSLSMKK